MELAVAVFGVIWVGLIVSTWIDVWAEAKYVRQLVEEK